MAIEGNREQSVAVEGCRGQSRAVEGKRGLSTAFDGNRRLKLTLKAWPVITFATIGLCFLTQQVAKWFGVELPDQQNVELVRQWLVRAFDSRKNFLVAASLVGQVVLLMPVIEECIFRWLLTKLPIRWRNKRTRETEGTHSVIRLFDYSVIAFSSALFSAAHYLTQPWPDAAFLALFFFGLAQCWLYKKTDRLWCPMLNHALFNLTNLILLFIVPAE